MSSEGDELNACKKEKLEKLIFFREGVKHEYNLLGQRISWYVTCQSFLVTAFTIAMGNPNIYFRLGFNILLPVLGILTSLLTQPSITGAIDTADIWKKKSDRLVEDSDLRDYDQNRKEKIARGDNEEVRDSVHEQSLRFVKHLSSLFIGTWIVFFVFGAIPNVSEYSTKYIKPSALKNNSSTENSFPLKN